MGLGVSLMHYVGMSAVHLAGPTSYAPSYVVASIAVSIAASAFALWTIDSRPTRPRLFLGAIALGLAISGMHYTAMAGMRLDPLCYDVSRFVGAESALSRNTLALLATIVAFGVSGAFLLSLVPDARAPRGAEAVPAEARTGRAAVRRRRAVSRRRRSKRRPPPSRRLSNRHRTSRLDPGREGRAPARHRRRATSTPSAPTPITPTSTTARRNISATLSISALEARLDPKAFLRVHRSYIVSVDRIARVKRSGEAGIAELGLPVRCSIPIARAHYRQVKLRIGAVAG